MMNDGKDKQDKPSKRDEVLKKKREQEEKQKKLKELARKKKAEARRRRLKQQRDEIEKEEEEGEEDEDFQVQGLGTKAFPFLIDISGDVSVLFLFFLAFINKKLTLFVA